MFRPALLSLMFGAAAVTCAAPRTAAAEMLLSQSFHSTALDQAMKYSVYLPTEYTAPKAAEQRYPVVYLLHGVGDNERAWPVYGKVAKTADRLIENGSLPPMIIVMPDAKRSWFVDSAEIGGPGDYATAVRADLVAHIDARFRTVSARRGRAIAGLSMGGFGAMRLGFERPEVYAAVASMSAALWSRLKPDSVLSERAERIFDGSFGTPFDAKRFIALSPTAYFDRVSAYPEHLGIYLHAGDDDGFGTHISTLKLFLKMQSAGIKAELRITDGDHQWSLWRDHLGEVLRFFAAEFARYDDADRAAAGGRDPS